MIRPANPADATAIAPLILLAMGDLAGKFANTDVVERQCALFERFIALTGNQYSYDNILVYESDAEIWGMVMGYDGASLDALRAPFLTYIREELGFDGKPEDETQPGEFYIDCLSVQPDKQGRGTGKDLIRAILERAQSLGHEVAGLLVSNPDAARLYKRLGFEEMGTVKLLGGNHIHMQRRLDPAF